MAPGRDWKRWHAHYEDLDSNLAQRLATVQHEIRSCLPSEPGPDFRVISMCAGEGRDLLGVLADHPHPGLVTGRLVELDPDLASTARDRARALGAERLEVVCGDASLTDAYLDCAPANLILVCGVLGNICDADVEKLITALPQLCTPGATVIWTRSRRLPDLTPRIRLWLQGQDLAEIKFVAPLGQLQAVGVNCYVGEPQALVPGRKLFSFVERSPSKATLLRRIKTVLRSTRRRPARPGA